MEDKNKEVKNKAPKKILFEKLLQYFEPYRQKRIELASNLSYLEKWSFDKAIQGRLD